MQLSFVRNGFEYTARCFERSVLVIYGPAHLADEPHSVRGNNAIANSLILKRCQTEELITRLKQIGKTSLIVGGIIIVGYGIYKVTTKVKMRWAEHKRSGVELRRLEYECRTLL